MREQKRSDGDVRNEKVGSGQGAEVLGGRVHLTTGPATQARESTVIRRRRPASRNSQSKPESREASANDEAKGSAYSGKGH